MIPGFYEVIETSRAFLRSGTVTGIDSVRRHLLYALWAGPTAIRYVTPPGHTHDNGSILAQPGSTEVGDLVHLKAVHSASNERA
jgi:hypothetical protein